MSEVSIVGGHHTPFGRFIERNRETGEVKDNKSYYQLIVDAGRGALADTGISPDEIDAVYLGTCSPGLFLDQEHAAAVAVDVDPAFRFKPMSRLEGACASSSVALYDAVYAVESGRYETVMVIGAEKMTLLDTPGVTHALACCSYYPEEGAHGVTFPGLFAELAKAYQAYYGISDEELRAMLAAVSALGYRNGAENPLAQFGPDGKPARLELFTAQSVLDLPEEGRNANPFIAPPLRLHDCSPISDGAVALVLAGADRRQRFRDRAVRIAGVGHAVDNLALSARRRKHDLEAAREAVRKAFAEARADISDMDMAEVHDCFTSNQIMTTEALGLSEPGRAGHDYMAGRFTREDRCPVNLSGGLKAKGHPVGATGASMHYLTYRQLVGNPIGASAASRPETGVVLNVGGAAVTNCATVLRAPE